jgi:hypothetical protein
MPGSARGGHRRGGWRTGATTIWEGGRTVRETERDREEGGVGRRGGGGGCVVESSCRQVGSTRKKEIEKEY